MKNGLSLLFLVIILSGCGITLKSVVDVGLTKNYENPLIVIPYESETINFSNSLKRNLEETFAANKQKVEIILAKVVKELTLNSNDDIKNKINYAIAKDSKDLIIVFKPVRLQFYNGGLQSAEYQLIGTDIETKREIWKASFSSTGTFGPSIFAKAAATKIFTQLKTDGVL